MSNPFDHSNGLSSSDTTNKQLILSPDCIPILSKQNAATFHNQVKQRIFETGEGLFEYVETIKFCESLGKQINGDSASKIEPDKEFIDYMREEIKKRSDKDNFTTAREVKFTLAETATTYDFSSCGDPVLKELEEQEAVLKDVIKKRKEFLKSIEAKGMTIVLEGSGEVVTIYPPVKTSKSSFKISLPK
jgi:hypothetical protein